MVFAGSVNEVAERIVHLRELLRHSRQILQMDAGGLPHATFLKSIELLGTKVASGAIGYWHRWQAAFTSGSVDKPRYISSDLPDARTAHRAC